MSSDDLKNHIVGALVVALSVEGKRGAQSVATAIDELIQYRINEALNPQPEPPAPPAFAVGTRVKLTEEHWGFPAGTTGQVARIHKANPNVVYVRIHGEEDIYRSPFHTNALEPLNSNLIPKGTFSDDPLPSDPGAPALSQDVLDLSPEEYKAYSMSKKIAIHERQFSKKEGFTPPYIIDALLSKGLIEAIGTGRETTYRAIVEPAQDPAPAGALPAGVTVSERSTSDTDVYVIKCNEDDPGFDSEDFQVHHTHSSSLYGIRYSNEHMVVDRDELARLVALGQYLLGKTGGDNGLH